MTMSTQRSYEVGRIRTGLGFEISHLHHWFRPCCAYSDNTTSRRVQYSPPLKCDRRDHAQKLIPRDSSRQMMHPPSTPRSTPVPTFLHPTHNSAPFQSMVVTWDTFSPTVLPILFFSIFLVLSASNPCLSPFLQEIRLRFTRQSLLRWR